MIRVWYNVGSSTTWTDHGDGATVEILPSGVAKIKHPDEDKIIAFYKDWISITFPLTKEEKDV